MRHVRFAFSAVYIVDMVARPEGYLWSSVTWILFWIDYGLSYFSIAVIKATYGVSFCYGSRGLRVHYGAEHGSKCQAWWQQVQEAERAHLQLQTQQREQSGSGTRP